MDNENTKISEDKIDVTSEKTDKSKTNEQENENIELKSPKSKHPKIVRRSESFTSFKEPIDLPTFYIVRPSSRIIPQLTEPGGKMIVQPNEPIMAKFPPEPIIINDKKKKEVFGLRCTCEVETATGTLVRCTKCGFYLHGQCVGVARVTPYISRHFVCPYCQNNGLRCPCGKNMKYDEPNIRCNICGYYSHKSCSHLLFGRNPSKFICFYCGGTTTPYPQPHFAFPKTTVIKTFTKSVDEKRDEIVQKLPEGDFRSLIAEVLNSTELDYLSTVERLFNAFGMNCFDDRHEFWKSFVSTIALIFDVPRTTVMDSIDELVTNFLYRKRSKAKLEPIPGLQISDSILSNVMSEQLYKIQTMPTAAQLSFTEFGSVCASEDLSDGQFICSVPGLLCHQDEVRAEDGIPLTCITIPGTPDCIDVSQSTNRFVPFIRRSFHYNCVVKIQSVGGEPKVMMYAARARGPLGSERSTQGPAIAKGSELFLPFDSDFPYNVEKKPWKVKKVKVQPRQKAKPRPKPKPKPKEKKERHSDEENEQQTSETSQNDSANAQQAPKTAASSRNRAKNQQQNTAMQTRNKYEASVELTLLSSFTEDGLSPFPFILKDENDSEVKSMVRQRHQSHILRNESDQE